jgi:cobalt/nickel transport system ATP-binding protein
MPILKTRGLYFSYEKEQIRENEQYILKNINIEIQRGSFVALLGANGCGKTTLIHQLSGLIKPGKGQVLLDGDDIGKLKDKQIFSKLGVVFQNPDDQLFSFTVFEDVAYGVVNLGIKGIELNKRVDDALRLLDIFDLKDREIHKLSYGQKKRVAIAGVLAMRPEVLILDEPTAGLDPMTSSALVKSLKRLQTKNGITIIIATHEVDIVPVICDYLYVMNKGKILLEGAPEQVFKNKSILRESNLRLPRIGHLMEILSDKDGLKLDSYPMTISGARRAIKDILKNAN